MRERTEADIEQIRELYAQGTKVQRITEILRNQGVWVSDYLVRGDVGLLAKCAINSMGAEADEVVKEIQQVHKVPPARIKSLLLSYTRTEILNGMIDEKGDLVPKDMVVYIPI